MPDMTEEELQKLWAEIENSAAIIKRQEEELTEKRVRYARAVCPYPVGTRLLNKRTKQVWEVQFIRHCKLSPYYEMDGIMVKKDGTLSQRQNTISRWDELEVVDGQ